MKSAKDPTARYGPSGLLLCLLLISCAVFANDTENQPVSITQSTNLAPVSIDKSDPMPVIGIIIDDIGNLLERDTRAIKLPGEITFAVLPHTPHAVTLANLAHNLDREVMVHLPMESMQPTRLGPGGLTLHMTRAEFIAQLRDDIEAVPFAVGLNNHMGSLLTQHPGHMGWLMQEIKQHTRLYFIDSYTTDTSIAYQIADEHWIPNLKRDVFLDNNRHPELIAMEFDRLLVKARQNGIALAIGHPYPETIALLERELPKLEAQGIQLLPVSKLLHHSSQRTKSWYASLTR